MSTALDNLAALFASEALGERYGETISIRDHMLQSAELARAQGLADSLIAAALLHDIGWAPALAGAGAAHEAVAADYLTPIFGAAVADPIRLHVAAKRFLVAREPDYFARLSAESVRTLARQGGPMDAAECLAFEALAGSAQALQLRRIDEAAKQPEPPASQFDDYRPMLRRLLIQT